MPFLYRINPLLFNKSRKNGWHNHFRCRGKVRTWHHGLSAKQREALDLLVSNMI